MHVGQVSRLLLCNMVLGSARHWETVSSALELRRKTFSCNRNVWAWSNVCSKTDTHTHTHTERGPNHRQTTTECQRMRESYAILSLSSSAKTQLGLIRYYDDRFFTWSRLTAAQAGDQQMCDGSQLTQPVVQGPQAGVKTAWGPEQRITYCFPLSPDLILCESTTMKPLIYCICIVQ